MRYRSIPLVLVGLFLFGLLSAPGVAGAAEKSRELKLSNKFLLIPIGPRTKAKADFLEIVIDGKPVYQYWLRVAPKTEKILWWSFFDVNRFAGKTATIKLRGSNSDGIGLIKLGAKIPGKAPLYKEKYRPQFHFSTRRGWINDPNGLIYYKGLYHMYYQYNPVSTNWGNMTWGHAVSKDLIHWKEQAAVLFPDSKGTCYSGAAFIDRKNLLGAKSGAEDVLTAFYLRTKIGLCMATSNDAGMTFTDYKGNPVLAHEGARIDTPRPFWYEPTKRWIAPTYDHFVNKAGKKMRAVGFYSSADLKTWKYESRVEQKKWGDELCGCVDFFQLPVDGDKKNTKWVMIMIEGSYIIGTFDGHVFKTLKGKPAATSDRIRSLVKFGNFYATQSWHNMPDDRRIQITWMRGGKYPGMPFNQQFTVPSELTLHSTPDGPRLRMYPIEEFDTLRKKTCMWDDIALKPDANPLEDLSGDLFDIEVEFTPGSEAKTIFDLRGEKVIYDAKAQTLSSGNVRSPLKPVKGVVSLRILLDRTSIEVFANDGRLYMPRCITPKDDNLSLGATCDKGQVKVSSLIVHELKSSWPKVAAPSSSVHEVLTPEQTRKLKAIRNSYGSIKNLSSLYTDRTHKNGLPYHIYVPKGLKPGEKYAMVTFLHGHTDLTIDTHKGFPKGVWSLPLVQKPHPHILFVPRHRTKKDRWHDEKYRKMMIEALDDLVKEFNADDKSPNIDPARLYLTGFSLGGMGTWNYIRSYPRKFAAAAPLSGYS
ncbi:MAG: GH32 C-terminal domain-containing protein, partial [Phycisphaerae bacterium]|nr:GH32 C-terminal domain-containing protein [Phycisphaerae bacterium]